VATRHYLVLVPRRTPSRRHLDPPTLVPPQENPKLPRRPRRATPHTLVATNNPHVNRRQPRPRQDQNYQRPTRHSRLRRLRVRKATESQPGSTRWRPTHVARGDP